MFTQEKVEVIENVLPHGSGINIAIAMELD